MPLLRFDTTLSLSPTEKSSLAAFVTDTYTEEMRTTDGHVAVTVSDHEPGSLHLGRAVDGPLVFLDANVREGRPIAYKRAFALSVMNHVVDGFGVPEPNCKVVFTEHTGEDMMGIDRVGGTWNGDDGGVVE